MPHSADFSPICLPNKLNPCSAIKLLILANCPHEHTLNEFSKQPLALIIHFGQDKNPQNLGFPFHSLSLFSFPSLFLPPFLSPFHYSLLLSFLYLFLSSFLSPFLSPSSPSSSLPSFPPSSIPSFSPSSLSSFYPPYLPSSLSLPLSLKRDALNCFCK